MIEMIKEWKLKRHWRKEYMKEAIYLKDLEDKNRMHKLKNQLPDMVNWKKVMLQEVKITGTEETLYEMRCVFREPGFKGIFNRKRRIYYLEKAYDEKGVEYDYDAWDMVTYRQFSANVIVDIAKIIAEEEAVKFSDITSEILGEGGTASVSFDISKNKWVSVHYDRVFETINVNMFSLEGKKFNRIPVEDYKKQEIKKIIENYLK